LVVQTFSVFIPVLASVQLDAVPPPAPMQPIEAGRV
jgi:hypothetical protein